MRAEIIRRPGQDRVYLRQSLRGVFGASQDRQKRRQNQPGASRESELLEAAHQSLPCNNLIVERVSRMRHHGRHLDIEVADPVGKVKTISG